MTDNEINVAIAKACGWTQVRELDDLYPDGSIAPGVWWQGIPPGESTFGQEVIIFDYCNDLNAMAVAENHMLSQDPSLRQSYKRQLIDVCDSDRDTPRHFWRATARQRAEAYIRTIGKWKD